MEHDPGDGHKSPKAKLKENKAHRKKETSATPTTSTTSSEDISDRRQLKFPDKIQAAMMTDLKLSKDEVDCFMTA